MIPLMISAMRPPMSRASFFTDFIIPCKGAKVLFANSPTRPNGRNPISDQCSGFGFQNMGFADPARRENLTPETFLTAP